MKAFILALQALGVMATLKEKSKLLYGGTIIAFEPNNGSLNVIRNGSLLNTNDPLLRSIRKPSQKTYLTVPK